MGDVIHHVKYYHPGVWEVEDELADAPVEGNEEDQVGEDEDDDLDNDDDSDDQSDSSSE